MTSLKRLFSSALLFLLCSPAVQSAGSGYDEYAAQFAHDRIDDVRTLINGPNRPTPAALQPGLSCIDLYQRRIALQHQLDDYAPPYLDDPRNQAAVFLGTIWVPAFYFLGYTAVTDYLDAARKLEPQAEIDLLRQASAAQRCFEK